MKYKLTDKTITYCGRTLYRIEALKDFSDIKAGDLGGWIQSEANLSQDGSCWVADNAHIYDNARVSGNAWVSDNAHIYGNARVSGNVRVYGDAEFKNGYIG